MWDTKYAPLRLKIILMTLLFSFVPLAVIGVGIYQQFSTAYSEKAQSNLLALVENKKTTIELFLNERVSQLTTIAFDHTFAELSNQARLDTLFSHVQRHSKFYVDFGVIDQDGNHVAYSGPYKLEGLNYKDTEWFQRAMRSGVYVSDVFLGFRKFPHFVIAVMRRENNKWWILRATIDSDIFENLFKSVQLGKKGDAFLVNSEFILQTTPRFGEKVLTKIDLDQRYTRFPGTRVELVDNYDRQVIYGLSWLDSKDWMLVIREDFTEEFTPLFKTQKAFVSMLVFGGLIIILGTVWVTFSTVKRLIQADREKAQLDAGLLQSSKMAALGKLAAGVAHEVNNPLAIIKEKAGWMKDLLTEEDVQASPNFQEFSDAVTKIEQHVERARTVTHRLLGFARRMEPVQENVDVNSILDQTVQFLTTAASHRNIDIRRSFAAGLPSITSDTSQLQQVFLNILNNAIDAVEKDGVVTITTAYDEHRRELDISISDTGPGIPPEVLDKIFDPFFTTKKVGEGTGLGLAISYSIVEKLGGRISVTSRDGQGATFVIALPVNR